VSDQASQPPADASRGASLAADKAASEAKQNAQKDSAGAKRIAAAFAARGWDATVAKKPDGWHVKVTAPGWTVNRIGFETVDEAVAYAGEVLRRGE
jgi:hypothetical protein